MKFLKRLLAASAFFVVIVAAGTLWLLGRGGAFKRIEPHFAGSCEALSLEGSGEDIVVDRERGIAYLSLLDRKSVVQGKDVQGTVARVDLNSRPFAAVTALVTQPAAFRPHGMSLYIGADGSRRLFVINHGQKRGVDPEAVELFDETAPGEFSHSETVAGPELRSPNDVAAVGPRQFYVANDKAIGGRLAAGLQADRLRRVAAQLFRRFHDELRPGGRRFGRRDQHVTGSPHALYRRDCRETAARARAK